ncbi:MAG: hypothetical protein KDB07_04045 [Planctomycetes bacterium]|nr:hypothetical protein [Planctomycetota bacterium]
MDDPASNHAASDADTAFGDGPVVRSCSSPNASEEDKRFQHLPLRQWPSFGEQAPPDREFDEKAPTILEIAEEFFGDLSEAEWEELPLYDPHQEEDASRTK